MIMLKQGIYKAENNDNIWDSYSVKMHVKETDKAYIFQLIDLDTLYSAAHIEMMFKRSKRYVLKKMHSVYMRHVCRQQKRTKDYRAS